MTYFLASPSAHAAIDHVPACSRRCLVGSPCQALQPRALDFESCRLEVHQAAMAKFGAGNSRSVKQCLLEVGFNDTQANNRTMQSRVRRQVNKLKQQHEEHERDPARGAVVPRRSHKQRHRGFVPPVCVTFSNKQNLKQNVFGTPDATVVVDDDDDVSVLTEGSGFWEDPMTSSTVSTAGTTAATSIPPEIPDMQTSAPACRNLQSPCHHGLRNAVTPRSLSPVTTRAILDLRNALQQQQRLQQQHRLGSLYSTPVTYPPGFFKGDTLVGSNQLHSLLEQTRLSLLSDGVTAEALATHQDLLRQAALMAVTPSSPVEALSLKVRLPDISTSAVPLLTLPSAMTLAAATTSIFQ